MAEERVSVAAREDHWPRAPKVVGLGAPISVRILLDASEVTFIRSRLLLEIDHHVLQAPGAASGTAATLTEWAEEVETLEGMLRALDRHNAGAVEVLWPTSVAHDILRGALSDALHELGDCDVNACAPEELSGLLDAAHACLRTWAGFKAVDLGGLE
ncbi:hypothetical protein OM076_13705 [Solirubrobacter ginsenosidimutans]|uniref:Uncharacterized protein n=1 Tax=Solirubrobacter ginsenosidimutans TaxID=490573 RepID=A0A9X3MU39_9ACTN|nr:hypothetical protein [Solirubrobacter ginsenosidimutans]MDA0161328.1 hypothetical protein [Solirubrobacter ginsenosidimutans]